MKIVFYDFENQLTWEGIKTLIDARVKELKAQKFSEEEIFRIVFGSKKFRVSFLEPNYLDKAMNYFQMKRKIKAINYELLTRSTGDLNSKLMTINRN